MYQTFAMTMFLLLAPLLLLLLSIKNSISSKPRLPPSPPKLPFIGNLHQLGSLPHHSLRALSDKHGPLMLLQLGRVPTLVVSSSEMAREALKTHDIIFTNRPPSKVAKLLFRGDDIAFVPYGEYWRQARKLCVTHLLSSKMVQSFQHVREQEVESMITTISQISSSLGSVDMSQVLNLFSSNIVSRAVSDKCFYEQERKDKLRICSEENNYILGAFHLADFFPIIGWFDMFDLDARAKRNAERWDEVLDEVIREQANRRKNDVGHKDTDFVDVLLSLENDYSNDFQLTRENMKALLIDMFAAGIDTSYIVLEWSMAELVRKSNIMKKLQNEVRGVAKGKDKVREQDLCNMSYLKAVIKEAMRLHPPAPLLLPRESIEICQIAGYQIPKKTRLIVNAWAIGRNPNFWEEPDEFIPERFMNSPVDFRGSDFQFIPFGTGRRICPGMNFAVQNIELALANLVNRFDWELPGNMTRDDLDMDDAPGLTSRKKQRLDLVAKLFPFE